MNGIRTEPQTANETKIGHLILIDGEIKTVADRWSVSSRDPKESERTVTFRFAEGGTASGLQGQTVYRVID